MQENGVMTLECQQYPLEVLAYFLGTEYEFSPNNENMAAPLISEAVAIEAPFNISFFTFFVRKLKYVNII
jgi:hypothetical protein